MFGRAACGTDPVARDGAKRKIAYPLIDDGYDDFNPRPCAVLLNTLNNPSYRTTELASRSGVLDGTTNKRWVNDPRCVARSEVGHVAS